MAVTTVTLKSNTWVTLDDAKDHLKIPLSNTDHDNRIVRFINTVTDMAEKYLNGPMKDRTFVEYKDGDASNTIVPDMYPLRSITELKIDANRTFDATSLIPSTAYVLRGVPDPLHSSGIRGESLVIRDDNNTSIIGRLFTGSVNGSIKLTYVAGWGANFAEIPADLTQAILMGVEYFYMLRENRDLGVKSKETNNQTYQRELGLPIEVTTILDTYIDYTLGATNVPQKNTFSI
jgi:hypothetical protein